MDQAVELGLLKDKLRARVPVGEGPGCWLCKLILEDLEKNGTLTKGYPEICTDGKPLFPVEGKTEHLYLEGFLRRPEPAAPKA
jgi:hypothetical protein